MKIKHLLLGMLAIAGTVACKPDEPLATPELKVDKEAVTLTATAGEATFNVTSNQDWTATADADWVSLEPASGAASKDAVAVKVTAEDNEATEARTATVTVKAGELTKTVALTQAGTEEVPGPELPTPNADWTSAKVVSYDLPESASSKRQLLKNIKYTFDENYFYVKLQASVAEFEAAPAEYLGVFVYDVVDGSGDGYYGWWNDAKGNTELEGEHIGVFSGKDITLTIGETPVEVTTEENGDELVWTLNILRSAHPNLALENPYFAFLTYIGWEPNGALPDKYEDMLQFTPAPKPVVPVTEGVIWENDGTVGVANWNSIYRFSIEGGDSQNECVAEIPAAIWAGMKIAPFTVKVTPDPTAEWWQIRILDGWWTNNDESGANDITVNTEGLVNYGDGTYAFKVDLTTNTELATLIDTNHLLFTGAGYTINKIYFGEPEAPAQPEPEYELEGKQWLLNAMDTYVLVDLGLYEEDVMVVAIPLMDGSGFGAYMYGQYEIEKTDATSGKIIFTQYDPEWDEFMDPVEYPYSELSENVVYISAESIVGDPTPLPFVALDEPFEIQFEEIGGGADPVGPIENGQYWFFNGTKVMAPLAEGETTGLLPAGNVIDGASTEKNIFTLMYDPDWSYYTIMDSYGRFLGQTDETGNITVTDVLPTDDTYAFYLWCVEPGYGEATSIYNAAYYYDFTYSATENKWVLVDGGYENPEILPILVKAENPVEEPVVPAFEPGEYFIMDGNGKVVVPIAESSTYGYWSVTAAVEDAGDYIGYAENVFTVEAVDGGYTIQDVYGRHHYMTTYNSFSVSTSTQSNGSHIWSITLQDDGSYAIVNNYTGKTVQFSSYGNYAPYTDVTGALPYLVKADKVAEKPQAPEEEVAEFETNVTCKTVSSAYTDGVATVNGVADVFTLKLGTSKLNGKATITLPAGTTEVTYYAVGWKGTSAKLQFSVGGTVAGTQSLAANTGATGNAPYTMTVSDSDHYTFTLGTALAAETEVTVETTGSAYRAILFGIQAK